MRISAILLLLGLIACGRSETADTTATTTSTTLENPDSMAVSRVAGDKTLIDQALDAAEVRGTLGAGLTEAAKDSLVAREMLAALEANGYLSAQTTQKAISTRATPRAKTSTASTAKEKQDALDKANDALDKANKTVEKSGEVVRKSEEVTRKAEDILRGRR